MPFGGPPLPDATIAVISQWITDGALLAAALSARTLQITGVSPLDDEVVRDAGVRVVVRFSHGLDSTRASTGAAQLVSREDSASGDEPLNREIAIDILVPAANA